MQLELEDIADVMGGLLREVVTPLLARIEALEQRELPAPEPGKPGEPGQDGADCDMVAVERMLGDLVSAAVAALPPAEPGKPGEPGRDGEDADMDVIGAVLRTMVDEAIDALPLAEPGKPGDPGKDGADVDMTVVERMLDEKVGAAVSALPAPAPGEPGADGVGLAGALIDREGELVLTLTDGSTKALGRVVGRDGDPGKDGHTFGLDDFDIEPIDERTIKMSFTYGEVKHSFELAIPAVIYRNVWREGETYQRGDLCTWAGSIWHCDKDNCTSKPDGGDWTLAVKRGRDGKDLTK